MDRLRNFAATITGGHAHPPLASSPPALKHAAALALRHFTRPLITLDDEIHVEDENGGARGTVTVREALAWVLTAEAAALFRDEPFGLYDDLRDFAARMLDPGEHEAA
jgi:hypothetical protein